ncbi:MAG TPA: hypothetical protein VK212_05955 [Lentimicrobium sp.]|nr:hypothetical protein [Lentimicrobium sp.]
MKKLMIFLSAALIVLLSCQKSDDLTANDMTLKKKPTTNNTTGGNNSFMITVPDGETDPLHISVGESVQLSVVPSLPCEWYVIDQQIAYVNWIGVVTGVSQGVTQISAFHYKEHGQPDQDNLVVYVE